MKLDFSEATEATVLNLAIEDEKTPEQFLTGLVEKEDRRRHVKNVEFQGEVRVRCYNEHCVEAVPRPTADDVAYEI